MTDLQQQRLIDDLNTLADSRLRDATMLVQTLEFQVREGKAVSIHCRAGIGRSSLIAAGVLICSGLAADDALRLIGIARGIDVPDTEAQREWVIAFGRATAIEA